VIGETFNCYHPRNVLHNREEKTLLKSKRTGRSRGVRALLTTSIGIGTQEVDRVSVCHCGPSLVEAAQEGRRIVRMFFNIHGKTFCLPSFVKNWTGLVWQGRAQLQLRCFR
jgi:hypothetical protein